MFDLFCEHHIAKRRHSQFLHRRVPASVFQHPFWLSALQDSNIGKGIHFGDPALPMPHSSIPGDLAAPKRKKHFQHRILAFPQ
jgi:hypothetical protein